MKIKDKIKKLSAQCKKLENEIKDLQDQCPHPKFVQGLTIVACVQTCWICEDCGYTKPLIPDWFADNPNG